MACHALLRRGLTRFRLAAVSGRNSRILTPPIRHKVWNTAPIAVQDDDIVSSTEAHCPAGNRSSVAEDDHCDVFEGYANFLDLNAASG